MDQLAVSGLLLVVLVTLLGSGVWIGLSLLGVGVFAMTMFTTRPIGDAMATTIWSHTSLWGLSALPLFIWMGEILFRSKLSETLFSGLSPLMRRLPGGLLHVNVVGCSTFAAISGSSAATLMTIGKMTMPQLKKHGYPDALAIGTLAGAGTLGLLIPPSITMIIYGVTVQESIGRLFIAGVLPGLMLTGLFTAYIMLWGVVSADGRKLREERSSLREKLKGAAQLSPIVGLIVAVIGSIYAGIASPTEAATLGVIGALILSAAQGSLSRESLKASLLGTVKTTSMIMLLLAGSAFLTLAMGFTGLPRALAEWIGGLGLSSAMLIAVLTAFYIFLGCFLDGISMIVLTMAVIEPLVREGGIDMIWFGVFVVLVGEMALITPPIGFNLFLVESMTGRGIGFVSAATLPMFLLMLLGVVLLSLFPDLALWLPEAMRSRD
ncbi:MAG: TRAP transporter large permease subunit [Alphaproteobacteria bacterium]|nr:TRAP transporter large permease subunit [Alphaproteobacteria bacterium]